MDTSQVNLMYLLLLILYVGSIFLQLYLSKRKDKISGLILPGIYFLSSLRSVFQVWGHGVTYREIIQILFLQNIITLILIIIYILSRRKINRDREIEKMNIQDLE